MSRRVVAAAIAAAALSACYTIRYERRSAIAEAGTPREVWHHGVLGGTLLISGPVRLHRRCPAGVAMVESEATPLNWLAQAFTVGGLLLLWAPVWEPTRPRVAAPVDGRLDSGDMEAIRVGALLDDKKFDLRLSLVAGRQGLSRRISSSRIQKPGLVLAGFTEYLHKERVQVFGNTEMSYLSTLPRERAIEVLRNFFGQDVACLVITKGLDIPPAMIAAAEEAGVPILRSAHLSSNFIESVQNYLEDILTAQTSMHGVLLDVFGVGILLLGKSGIGKSEIALDLVMRGHRLVADDIVDVKRRSADSVQGAGSEIIKHHMEIRGLGIINIKDLFGVAAIRERKKIEIVLELVEWDPNVEYDRLGVEEKKFRILDVEIPMLIVPVRPGRNMTTIVEVAARNHLLKLQGHHSAREFQERLNRAIALAPGARVGEMDVE